MTLPRFQWSSRKALVTARSLALAALGGTAFYLLGMPAAYLSGGVVAVGLCAILGVDTRVPRRMMVVVQVFLGSTLGAAASPELIRRMVDWPVSLVVLILALFAMQWLVQAFFQRVAGWDRDTAFFAAVPGAMSYVLALAPATRADMTKVVIAQSLRVFLIAALTPSIINAIEPGELSAVVRPQASLFDIGLTLACGILGALIFTRLKISAAALLGSLFFSIVLHASGLAHGTFPTWLTTIGFIGLAATTGARFTGTNLFALRAVTLAAIGGFAVAVAFSGVVAYGVALLTRMPFGQVALAYAPGGLDVTITLALALHMDSAFVAVHQFLRFLVVSLLSPFVTRSRIRRLANERVDDRDD